MRLRSSWVNGDLSTTSSIGCATAETRPLPVTTEPKGKEDSSGTRCVISPLATCRTSVHAGLDGMADVRVPRLLVDGGPPDRAGRPLLAQRVVRVLGHPRNGAPERDHGRDAQRRHQVDEYGLPDLHAPTLSHPRIAAEADRPTRLPA